MKLLRYYAKERNKEVVVVTDLGEFPIWEKDFERLFSSLSSGDEIEDPDGLLALAVAREIKKSAVRKISAGNITRAALIRRISSERMFGIYPERETVVTVVDKLARAGFINDASFAKRFVEKSLEKDWGELKLRAAMRERGFESADIDTAIAQASPDWEGIARAYVEKNSGEDRQTLYRRLQTRGFTSDVIINVLNGD